MGGLFGAFGMLMGFQCAVVTHDPSGIRNDSLASAWKRGQMAFSSGRDLPTGLTKAKKCLNFQTLPVDAPWPL